MKSATFAFFAFLLLSASGCGGRGPDMPPEEIQLRADYLRDLHEYEWEMFEQVIEYYEHITPHAPIWQGKYGVLLETRNRARRSGRDYLQFLETLGRRARSERSRIKARLDRLDRLEQDMPYR